MKKDSITQFVPAAPGWLALFEYEAEGEFVIHAEPVIAWCLGTENGGAPQFSSGKAVIGANPWVEKADDEDAGHFFTLVREEQLEPEFLKDLRQASQRTRESILEQARKAETMRREGHGAWIRDRRRSHHPGA